MRVTEQLIRDANRKKRQQAGFFDEEEEETMTYASWKPQKPLNRRPGPFSQQKMTGINSRESVFDQNAVFRTSEMTRRQDGKSV